MSTPVAISTELPILVLDALAQAQLHQNTGMAIGVASAKADAAAGNELGGRLSALLSTTASFDAEGARLIGLVNEFPVELHFLELLAGLCPLIALMTEMTRRHHCSSSVRSGSALLKVAEETTFVNGKGVLNIDKGCRHFIAAYDLATTREHHFYPDPVYRALISNLVSADSAFCRAGGNEWVVECREYLRGAIVHDSDPTGSPLYTREELSTLVGWLKIWSFNAAREEADLAILRQNSPAVLALEVAAPASAPLRLSGPPCRKPGNGGRARRAALPKPALTVAELVAHRIS
jgi:hypothetical protein